MRIIFFLILILLIAVLFLITRSSLNRRSKTIVGALGIAMITGALVYNEYENISNLNREKLLEAFEQGKTIKCAKIDVNSARFNYEYGTSTFVAKRGFIDIAGVKISLDECENEDNSNLKKASE